jgi:hypothetical protein
MLAWLRGLLRVKQRCSHCQGWWRGPLPSLRVLEPEEQNPGPRRLLLFSLGCFEEATVLALGPAWRNASSSPPALILSSRISPSRCTNSSSRTVWPARQSKLSYIHRLSMDDEWHSKTLCIPTNCHCLECYIASMPSGSTRSSLVSQPLTRHVRISANLHIKAPTWA